MAAHGARVRITFESEHLSRLQKGGGVEVHVKLVEEDESEQGQPCEREHIPAERARQYCLVYLRQYRKSRSVLYHSFESQAVGDAWHYYYHNK